MNGSKASGQLGEGGRLWPAQKTGLGPAGWISWISLFASSWHMYAWFTSFICWGDIKQGASPASQNYYREWKYLYPKMWLPTQHCRWVLLCLTSKCWYTWHRVWDLGVSLPCLVALSFASIQVHGATWKWTDIPSSWVRCITKRASQKSVVVSSARKWWW